MNSTGKRARKQFGTRVACKRAKTKRRTNKVFGSLPVSNLKGNADAWIRTQGGRA